jgi:triacylglycerol esterase/lipase EstA (alpha/beta hydrolase family)
MAGATVEIKPDTIVLIHGFWVTPRSWEHWKEYFEEKGYTVLTLAYPGFEVEVEALRADPTPIEQLRVPEIIDMLENMIGKLDRPPIIIGHSAGGVFTQILRSRVRRGRGGDELSANRGREGHPALGDQVLVPHAEESCEPAPSGRLHAGTMALRVYEHVQ